MFFFLFLFHTFFIISYWNSVEFEQFQFELVYCRAKFKWRSNFGGLHSAWHIEDSYWIHNLSETHTKKRQVIQIHWLNWIFDLLLLVITVVALDARRRLRCWFADIKPVLKYIVQNWNNTNICWRTMVESCRFK